MPTLLLPNRGAIQVLLICVYLVHFTTGFGTIVFSSTLQQPRAKTKLQQPRHQTTTTTSSSKSPPGGGGRQQKKNEWIVNVTLNDYEQCDGDGNSLSRNNFTASNVLLHEQQSQWASGKNALGDPGCCVVSICSPGSYNNSKNSLTNGLLVLQHELADHGPSDIDIRARINTTTIDSAYQDCSIVWNSVFDNVVADKTKTKNCATIGSSNMNSHGALAAIASLTELARGMSSFAENNNDQDPPNNPSFRSKSEYKNETAAAAVYMRIVCASNYRAHDPSFHTDKAPLRGYVTLRGVGTEFVTHPCSPLEYMGLRALGTAPKKKTKNNKEEEVDSSLRCAQELEFIVMKGDYYYEYFQQQAQPQIQSAATTTDSSWSWKKGWWQREFACVHRSPPGGGIINANTNANDEQQLQQPQGRRRVIVSFDLADGDDDREWHDVAQKRQWRSGMTQRKSRLVA